MRRPLIRLPLVAAVLALVLAAGAAVLPPAAAPVAPFLGPLLAALDAPVALAADDLSITTKARYVVVPDEGGHPGHGGRDGDQREAQLRSTGGVVTRYFYDVVNLGVQPEATRFRATAGGFDPRRHARSGARATGWSRSGCPATCTSSSRPTVRLTYDLPARQAPLGERRPCRTCVRVVPRVGVRGQRDGPHRRPGGVRGGRLGRRDGADDDRRRCPGVPRLDLERDRVVRMGQRPQRRRPDPRAAGPRAAGRRSSSAAGRRTRAGAKRVVTILGEGIPELTARIGLPWPVDGPLSVLEIHTPLLEGYAGFYNPQTDEITISEDLDDVTIIHEASHAWFNRDLFDARWITEGLAETYAAQVVDALGRRRAGPGQGLARRPTSRSRSARGRRPPRSRATRPATASSTATTPSTG